MAACSSSEATPSDDDPKDKPTQGDDDDDDDNGTSSGGNASDTKDAPVDPDEAAADEDFKDFLEPPIVNTGFIDATKTFKVPLFTDFAGERKWTVADPSILSVEEVEAPSDYEDDPKHPLFFAMITTKKAGKTKITLTAGSKKAETEVTVKAYTADQYATGMQRYKTGGTEANRKPCASCHEAAGGADHSPTWLSFYEDDDVLTAIQTAVYASDKYEVNKGNHKWNLTEAEKPGIMAYLRGLQPRNFK
jgi:hypothetical protein